MDELEKVQRRTYRYWYEDGLADLGAGWVFALLSILFLLQALAPAGPLAGISAILLPLVIIGGGLLARWAIAGLKARITYPRTGYVSYRQPTGRRRRLSALLAMGMAMLVAFFVVSGPVGQSWIPLLTGLVIGAGLLYIANRFGLGRYFVLAAASVVAGAAGSFLTRDIAAGDAIYFGAMAVCLVVSGGLTLWGYLRRSGSPGQEGADA
jgi:hypothetical protein